jgi:NAD(P)-dependent dehydrogenase (short-subunit alcohol dehydrogenase family)
VNLPGTIEDTAEEASALGGQAIPIRCDHADDAQTQTAIERIRSERGRLDVLVNNVWGGYEYMHRFEFQYLGAPFWTRPVGLWDEMFVAGPRAHYVTSALAAPLMVAQRSGLVVNISFFDAEHFRGDVIYSLAKGASQRMAAYLAEQLREHAVAAVALYPGLVRTEAVLQAGEEHFDFSNSESPQFVGRAVAALAGDRYIMERTGLTLVAAEIGEEYGFPDVDGKRPRSIRAEYG